METVELKRCPFCGIKDRVKLLTETPYYEYQHNRGRRAVVCTLCGCSIFGRNQEEAIERWNRRADDERI
ncbi:MAG: Lar family restriction alleviation protein [Clostridia bacterium]|nr:Lar family restriction alleviation protein [Clostridia bacterium]